jgi:hypothetical protein
VLPPDNPTATSPPRHHTTSLPHNNYHLATLSLPHNYYHRGTSPLHHFGRLFRFKAELALPEAIRYTVAVMAGLGSCSAVANDTLDQLDYSRRCGDGNMWVTAP